MKPSYVCDTSFFPKPRHCRFRLGDDDLFEVNVNEMQISSLAEMWVSIHGDYLKGEKTTFSDDLSIIGWSVSVSLYSVCLSIFAFTIYHAHMV